MWTFEKKAITVGGLVAKGFSQPKAQIAASLCPVQTCDSPWLPHGPLPAQADHFPSHTSQTGLPDKIQDLW